MDNLILLKYFISIFFFVLSCSIYAAPSHHIHEEVNELAEAAAVLNICFENPKFQDLPSHKSVKIYQLTFRLRRLIKKIAKFYRDKTLVIAFEMMRVKLSSDAETKSYVKSKYDCCNDDLLSEMEIYVSENEMAINKFLSN